MELKNCHCEDGSIGKVLATKAFEPESGSLNPHEKPDAVAYTCNYSIG